MKVVVLSLSNQGGMIHYASQLSNALSEFVDTHVIVGSKADDTLFSKKVNINKVNLVSKALKNNNFFNFLDVKRTLEDIQPDIIHITCSHIWILPLYRYLLKKNVVLTLHDVNEHMGERDLLNRLCNYTDISLANNIFVHCHKLKKDLSDKGYRKKLIHVIPHGNYLFFTTYNSSVPEDGSILFFGRILEYKGLEYLIEAIPKVKSHLNKCNVIIAGKGNFDKYRCLIEDIEDFEIINEFIPDKMVAELFQRSSIVVLPYVEASQTGVIPIAYSFRKPVIATNVGCIPEIVESGVTGYIVQPRNSNELATSIVKILSDDKLRIKMGENAHLKVTNELSWDSIAKATITVYNNILKS